MGYFGRLLFLLESPITVSMYSLVTSHLTIPPINHPLFFVAQKYLYPFSTPLFLCASKQMLGSPW